MPRCQPPGSCSPEELATSTEWSSSRTLEARIVERARIILGCIPGEQVIEIARDLGIRPNTVIDWRKRFEAEGLEGLDDRPRPGKPELYSEDFRNRLVST